MKQSLNYSWKFVPNFSNSYLKELPKEAEIINIPHTVKEMNYNYQPLEDYQFVSTYEKIFDVDNFDKDKRYFIRFEGYMVSAKIYFNEQNIGFKVSAYIPVEIEVTEFIKEKNNRLLVILDSKEDNNVPPFGFALDYATFGGIYREVYLISEPKTFIKNIYVHGDSHGNGEITFKVVGGDKVAYLHKLYSPNGECVKSFNENRFHIDNPLLWDIDHPNLYTLVTELMLEDKVIATYQNRFGFRDIEFNKNGFFLNGKQIKLVGLNRHQSYPYMGYAASKSLQEMDADLLKYEVGVNVVRTSHYPQSEHFLSRCDEIGLLVVNEIPGWQHIGSTPEWRNQCLKNVKAMVTNQRRHTSVIAHGVRIDESIDDHDLYMETNRIAHELDPFRPTIGVRNFANSELLEDIYGYNDFICSSLKVGLTNPKKVKHHDKALLVTEYMGHMDPYKATTDQEKRLEVALRHAKVINDNFKYKNLAGAIGWCFVDYQTHVDFGSGDYICAHGVYDLYRNPKYSAYIYASQQDKFPVLELLTNLKPGDLPEALFGDIYVATNCDYIELYADDNYVGKFFPNKKQFESLKHPPILIDDLVGETFKEAKFSAKIAKNIAKALSFAAIHGFSHLKLSHKILLAYTMMRYKLKYSDLVHYWNKYVGAWGGKAKVFTIKGYIDGEFVKSIEVGPSNSFNLEVSTNKDTLVNEDTYDTTRIVVRHVDNHGALCLYSSRPVEISVSGPIELIGPNIQSLLGGQLSIFIKSKQKAGEGKVTIKMDDFVKEISLKVK